MRTQTQIDAIVSEAELTFSAKMNEYMALKQRGVQEPVHTSLFDSFRAVHNNIRAIQSQTVSLASMNEYCDYIIQSGFFSLVDSNLFSEEIYDEDGYDVV